MAILRKIKDKIKTIASTKKSTRLKKEKKVSKKTENAQVSTGIPAMRNAVLGANETVVGNSKFSHPQVTPARRMMPTELPGAYDIDRIVLQVRDPWWLHTYWDVRHQTIEKLRAELKEDFYKSRKILRVYDVSNINFNGTNAHRFFDIQVNDHVNSWYIDTASPGKSWCVDLGLLTPDGRFILIVRSNIVTTPIDGPSWVTDEEWMIPEEIFARLYGMSFGFGQTSPVGKAWQERMKKALFSGILSSPGLSSGASAVRKEGKSRKFWMVVDCELIVYGATEPDAHVTVQDKPIALRPDGTFTLRFALPDGKQVIPVKAVSSDKEEERLITPIVTRETKVG